MTKIAVILGTTRPERFGEQPANWLLDLANEHGGAEFELVDLRELNLPLFNETISPKMGQPLTSEAGQKWSQIVDEADGFVFITGEYDHTIPASLSNALQHVYYQWHNKPVAYVGYGAALGGGRAIEHLRQVAGELGHFDIDTAVYIPNYWTQVDQNNGKWTASQEQTDDAKKLVDKLVFWTDVFKDARAKLAK